MSGRRHAARMAALLCCALAALPALADGQRDPGLRARLSLRLSLRANGSVARVHITDADVPAAFATCLEQAVMGWRFPSPGGPLTFEAPLRFRAAP